MTPPHTCHAEGCQKPVPPKMLMCPYHWRQVPRELRAAVWEHYRPGQEVDKQPSAAYLEAMQRAIRAVAEKEKATNG